MSVISQYQTKFRLSNHHGLNGIESPKIAKRHRQTVSCILCRSRKLKCDRRSPCSNCASKGEACGYSGKTDSRSTRPNSNSKAAELQLRLQNLEQMILGLADSRGNSSESRSIADEHSNTSQSSMVNSHFQAKDDITVPSGHLRTNGLDSNYLGATNWTTILDNVRDIQHHLDMSPDTEEVLGSSDPDQEPDLIFSSNLSLTMGDVFASLPYRKTADILLSTLFESGNSHIPILHTAKFLREYEAFWADPPSASFLWISVLFSVFWLGSYYYMGPTLDGFDHLAARSLFFKKAGQTLVEGKYHKGRPFSVEAVMLHAHCKYFMLEQTEDADAWMIIGTAVRLAMKMGYHRDPRHVTSMTQFESEMRRRSFFTLQMFDLLLSFKAGLPAIIREEDCDTETPRNLRDEDFDEDCQLLPPSRPETERTPMLYFCYKSKFTKFLKRVISHALSLKPPSYTETLGLDTEIQEAHKHVPPSLQMKPFSSLLSDTARMLVSRLHIELLFLKSLCVLHRIYISQERSSRTYDYSRRICTTAALQILDLQAQLHEVTRPGSRFADQPWIFSSLTMHDFLLAAMILCLDLHETHNRPSSSFIDGQTLEMQQQIYDALRRAQSILSSQEQTSTDSRRASNVLAAMLRKIPRPVHPLSTSLQHNATNAANTYLTSTNLSPSSSALISYHPPGNVYSQSQEMRAPQPAFEFSSSTALDAFPTDNPLHPPQHSNGPGIENEIEASDPLADIFLSSFNNDYGTGGGGEIIDWETLDQYINAT